MIPRFNTPLAIALAASLAPSTVRAQPRIEPERRGFWIASALAIAGAAALDAPLERAAARNESATLDRFARDVDPLGRARVLVPSIAITAIAARLAHRRSLFDAAIRIGLGYYAADGAASLVKPIAGRHRPDASVRPGWFRPFRTGGPWGSFPSAHAVHAFGLATGVAIESHRPWVAALAYGLAATVGAQRIYTRAHWASDVAAGATLAIASSATTVRWLERGGAGGVLRDGPAPGGWSLSLTRAGARVSVAF